ncbi:MAG: HAD hydrolase-like protein [Candidatus Actinomarina sp.]|nr:HAD hydrolase-like protein [Candidatus Actinomarina sp.]
MSIIATDLDGTIYKGQTLIDGVKEGLLEIINEGIEIYYTTNNSSQTPSEIKNKLKNLLNLNIDISKIITPLVIFENMFSDNKLNVFIYGSENLVKYIKNLNMNVTSLENAELILIGRKEENNYSEINEIINNVSLGKNILSLNKDLTFPTEFGEKAGNGAVVKIIEDELSINIPTLGKSGNHYSSYFIQNRITVNFVIGDRVDTDIIFGKNLNAKTFLVSSGIKNYLDVNIADVQLNKFSDVVPFLTKQS